jgi:PilZ domain
MDLNPEKRDTPRFEHEATVMIEDFPAGQYHEGRMYNYSRAGMYFESDFSPKIGSDIFIGIEDSPYSSGHDVYRARVMWCRELPEVASYYYYGVGVKYY